MQAQTAAALLASFPLRRAYVSDYRRTWETVEPLRACLPELEVLSTPALRGREKEDEALESHVERVRGWLDDHRATISAELCAVVSHCGTLNILQFYLEHGHPPGTRPFVDEQWRHTPLGGVWEIAVDRGAIERRSIFDGRISATGLNRKMLRVGRDS